MSRTDEQRTNWDHQPMKEALEGRTILVAYLCPEVTGEYGADGRFDHGRVASIALNTDMGWLRLTPEGECCANCFIQHISLADALQGAKVTLVEPILEVEKERGDGPGDGYAEQWGHRIHTTKGTCTIEMRVEHNGYYGGMLKVEGLENPKPVLDGYKTLEDF